MATTVERNTIFRYQELPAIEVTGATTGLALAAGAKVLKGTFALSANGTVISGVEIPANASNLLGIAEETYDNTGSGAVKYIPMVFRRGQCFVDNQASVKVVGPSSVGFNVWIKDNISVESGTAPDPNSSSVRCVGISADGKQVEIYIP